ncbi:MULTISPECIES: hypothetical protein [unclassified Pseudomonas]|uniref:hypothetical protein n=1 Tax=unclassified Pseudomonas TaxID=196821 RepID=UPI00257F05B4|nr:MULTISPECIES: hypothetical protein [unclassified Pseudomonas]
MKRIIILLAMPFFLALINWANADDSDLGYIEDAQIILNRMPIQNGTQGYLLATPCMKCQVKKFSFDSKTLFYVKGEPVSEKELGGRIDWRGMIMFSPKTPSVAHTVFLQ